MTPSTAGETASQIQLDIQRRMLDQMEKMNGKLSDVAERVVRIEERDKRIEENRTMIAGLRTDIEEQSGTLKNRVGALEEAEALRKGGSKAWQSFLHWWAPLSTVLGIAFMVVCLLLRATGILHLPNDKPAVRKAPLTQSAPVAPRVH